MLATKMRFISAETGVTIPQYFESDPGTLQYDFENAANYATDGTVEENTSQFITGNHSIKLIKGTSDTSDILADNNISWNFGGSAPNFFRLYFHPHDADGINAITVRMRNIDTGALVQAQLFNSGHNFHDHWMVVEIYPSQWSFNGGDWNSTFTQFSVFLGTSVASTSVSASFDSVWIDPAQYPAAFFSFDDGYASDYSIAFNYMNQQGVPRGTTYVPADTIDSGASKLSTAQLQEMDAAGWSIANHGESTSESWASGTQAEAEGHINACITALENAGVPDAKLHAAYPTGAFSDPVKKAMEATGMLTGRITNGDVRRFYVGYEGARLYMLSARQIDASITLATAKGWVDDAVANNDILALFFHELVASGATGLEWNQSDFEELVDYIITQEMPFVTINDIYDSVSGPVTVPATP